MPTYDFRCPQGHEFERFYRKISEAPTETPCPECGETAKRQLSAGAGLLFKGSGFYLTDYGKNAHRKTGSAGKSNDAKSSEPKSGDAASNESKSSSNEGAKGGTASSESKSETSKPADSGSKKPGGSGTD